MSKYVKLKGFKNVEVYYVHPLRMYALTTPSRIATFSNV